jgi:DNA-binding CsgD family transcriptional regulator
VLNVKLTARETDVAKLMSQGLSNKLIAVQLGLSEHTVKFHVKNVCTKYKTSSRVVAAVGYAVAQVLETKPLVPA